MHAVDNNKIVKDKRINKKYFQHIYIKIFFVNLLGFYDFFVVYYLLQCYFLIKIQIKIA
jgi:hypothetical protein